MKNENVMHRTKVGRLTWMSATVQCDRNIYQSEKLVP